MGNLEKAGVLVVVALLAMILVITVLNPPVEVPPVRNDHTLLSNPAPRVDAPNVTQDPIPTTPGGAGAGLTPVDSPIRPDNPTTRPAVLGGGVLRPDDLVTPTPLPAPFATPASLELVKVKLGKGDSLYKIAAKRYGSRRAAEGVKAIEAANPGLDAARLKLGSEIEIPKSLPAQEKSEKAEKLVSSDGTAEEKLSLDRATPKTPAKPSTKKPSTKRQPLPFEGG